MQYSPVALRTLACDPVMYAGLGPLGAGIVARQDAPADAAAVEECSDQASWPLLSGGALGTAVRGPPALLLWRETNPGGCVPRAGDEAAVDEYFELLHILGACFLLFGTEKAFTKWQAPRLSTISATMRQHPSNSCYAVVAVHTALKQPLLQCRCSLHANLEALYTIPAQGAFKSAQQVHHCTGEHLFHRWRPE